MDFIQGVRVELRFVSLKTRWRKHRVRECKHNNLVESMQYLSPNDVMIQVDVE